jgi:hypothetical protein
MGLFSFPFVFLFLISVVVVTAPDAITSCDERYQTSRADGGHSSGCNSEKSASASEKPVPEPKELGEHALLRELPRRVMP